MYNIYKLSELNKLIPHLGYVILGLVVLLSIFCCYGIGRMVGVNCFYEVCCCNCCRTKAKQIDYTAIEVTDDGFDAETNPLINGGVEEDEKNASL